MIRERVTPLVNSMTGYGRGELTQDERSFTLEVRSVNNKRLDCTIKMPHAYSFAEDALRSRVQSAISRGKVEVYVNASGSARDGVNVTVNRAVAQGYYNALRELRETFALKDDISVSLLAGFPDVLAVEKAEVDPEAVTTQLCAALDLALAEFTAMRTREGEKMSEDILGRLCTLEQFVSQVETRSPQTLADYHARLEKRLREVLENTQIDESRILTEAAIFADKIAVDEETVRLRSHISQFRTMLAEGGPVGRKLDFLVQEMNRETNTIGSKCSDLQVTKMVVDMKAEIEKIREQIQNLE